MSSTPSTKNKIRGVIAVKHANVCLDIDIHNKTVSGYVEYQLICKTKNLSQLHFHARQLSVTKVKYNGSYTSFQQKDFLKSPCDSRDNSRDVRTKKQNNNNIS